MRLLYTFLIVLIATMYSCNFSSQEKNDHSANELNEYKKRVVELEKKLDEKANYNNTSVSYISIGSTIDDVIDIQGQPTSSSNTGYHKTFYYSSSHITFVNGKVESYYNAGNLKININQDKLLQEPSGETKYIYFTIISSSSMPSFGSTPNQLEGISVTTLSYTDVFTIYRYTVEKENELKYCLITHYKKWTGNAATLISNVYDSQEKIMHDWNNETGNLFSAHTCSVTAYN